MAYVRPRVPYTIQYLPPESVRRNVHVVGSPRLCRCEALSPVRTAAVRCGLRGEMGMGEPEAYYCSLCEKQSKHDEDNRCSECGGCEHCCFGENFKDCELKDEEAEE